MLVKIFCKNIVGNPDNFMKTADIIVNTELLEEAKVAFKKLQLKT